MTRREARTTRSIEGSDAPRTAPIAGMESEATLLSILMVVLRSKRCAPSRIPRCAEMRSTAGRLSPTTRNTPIASLAVSGGRRKTE